MQFDPELEAILLDPTAITDWAEHHPDRGFAADCHACTHLTISPNVLRRRQDQHDPRKRRDGGRHPHPARAHPRRRAARARRDPGRAAAVRRHRVLRLRLGDVDRVTRRLAVVALDRARLGRGVPGRPLRPGDHPGGTDARFFRDHGCTSYGYGLFSRELGYDDYVAMFHAKDERVDVHSLGLMEQLWADIAVDLLGERHPDAAALTPPP
ncbi:MAG: hypothetical protein R2713_06040 [Ilumatobacteraceae bacterium]